MSRRILIQLSTIARQVDGKVIPNTLPKVFTDWYDFADYVKQENLAGRSVTINNWEYV